MSPRVIGLGGHLRAGKDAAADYLVSEHDFVKLGMSDALHEALLAIDPRIEAAFFPGKEGESAPRIQFFRYSELVAQVGYVEAKKNPEVRRLLQKLGTEVGRDMIGEDILVDIVERKVRRLVAEGRSVVLTGVRFPNELHLVDVVLNGQTVWISRPGHEPDGSAGVHASETSVHPEHFARTVINDGSLEGLRFKVDALLK